MGSDKSAAGSSSSQPPVAAAATAAVCCMCGDRGLLPELFRCAACAVRSQHTYCTERYPKAESYGTCNWCLRVDQGSNGGGGGAATSSSARPSTARAGAGGDPASSSSSRSVAAAKVVAARGHFTAELSKPIKKPPPPLPQPSPAQRRILLRRSASDLGGRVRRADHDAPPSPGVARGRPRVRRYKLLEEVITTS
uniref:PHD-type zinc finger plants domain-containing protein n=1 Tax=Oryza punctata TaxID=4537 RepID=A0A0E0K9U5_ORYPU